MDGSLPNSLKHIISNAEYYGPSLFLLATDVVSFISVSYFLGNPGNRGEQAIACNDITSFFFQLTVLAHYRRGNFFRQIAMCDS